MKKLYEGKSRRVHPTPLPPPPAANAATEAPPAALPAALQAALPGPVLPLAGALTAQDQEVLAYLLADRADAGGRRRRPGAHPPEMGCGCFGCYKSFWERWDASPNRHIIHRIIDEVEEGGAGDPTGVPSGEAVEEGSAGGPRRRRSRRGRRRSAAGGDDDGVTKKEDVKDVLRTDGGCVESNMREEKRCDGDDHDDGMDGDENETMGDGNGSNGNKSIVRCFVSFMREKVFGAWD